MSGENSEQSNAMFKPLELLLLMLLKWQSAFHISDKALDTLFLILKVILSFLNRFVNFGFLIHALNCIPQSLKQAKKMAGLIHDEFSKYVVCPECDSLYDFDNVVKRDRRNGNVSATCTTVHFPHHPHKSKRKACGAALMKAAISIDGKKTLFFPKKVYCTSSIKENLQRLVSIPGFIELLKCSSNDESEVMFDITDGNVWKTFRDVNNHPYFEAKRNLAAMINVDWFNPYENTEHSEGVIYLSILNIDRMHRNKWDYIMLLGVIPGPREPALTINTYLKPIVDELEDIWQNGILINEGGFDFVWKVAVLCVSSDLPATRKCCGFMSYNSLYGKFGLSFLL